jgi:hypothetical protein
MKLNLTQQLWIKLKRGWLEKQKSTALQPSSVKIASQYLAGAPVLQDNPTLEQVEQYVAQVLAFTKSLPDKRLGVKLQGREWSEVVDLVMAGLLDLHFNAERAIFNAGVVEVCKAQTSQTCPTTLN